MSVARSPGGMKWVWGTLGLLVSYLGSPVSLAQGAECDHDCLEAVARQYREAYVAHDTALAPFADRVRFSENFVMMPFPDGTWDTVTEEVGPPLVLSDPVTGQAAIFTSIRQLDTPGFLAIRLRVAEGRITEVEHVISTRRNLSGPPTPIADDVQYDHDPVIDEIIPPDQRQSRAELMMHAAGYFATLERNDGEIRGTRFTDDAQRRENGRLYDEIEAGFESGFYWFNDRVRHWPILVDERRGVALSRGFIDHKGDIDEYLLADGSLQRAVYREPHSWGFLEMFKVVDDHIDSVVATFIGVPYNMTSPWNPADDQR